MVMTYNKLSGQFDKDKPNMSAGLMAKQVKALTEAGPKGHKLAYITPEEEKLLNKATGKSETMITDIGIPSFESDMTLEEMESNLLKMKGLENLEEIKNEAMELARQQNRESISKAGREGILSPKEVDEKLTESFEQDYNIIYPMLLSNELNRLKKIEQDRYFGMGELIERGTKKVKSMFNKPKKGESSLDKAVEGTVKAEDKYSMYPAMNIMGYEVPGPRALLMEKAVKPLMQYLQKNKEEFNPDMDYDLNKFLMQKQQEMKSKEPYIPPRP